MIKQGDFVQLNKEWQEIYRHIGDDLGYVIEVSKSFKNDDPFANILFQNYSKSCVINLRYLEKVSK